MAFEYQIFDTQVERNLKSEQFSWPEPGEAMDDSGLGCNRMYEDLRRLTWRQARHVYAIEGEIIKRIEKAIYPEEEYEKIENEYFDQILGLDLGVASTVVSLSAARCIPFTSCNGGTFGGYHSELYPLVGFYAKSKMKALLLKAAEESSTGLENSDFGHAVVYADDIRKMRAFARSLITQSSAFRKLRLTNGKTRRPKKSVRHEQQLILF